jgi:hypothetical protein
VTYNHTVHNAILNFSSVPLPTDLVKNFTFRPSILSQVGCYPINITLADPNGGITNYTFNLSVYHFPRFQSLLVSEIKVRIRENSTISLVPALEPWPVVIRLRITPKFCVLIGTKFYMAPAMKTDIGTYLINGVLDNGYL